MRETREDRIKRARLHQRRLIETRGRIVDIRVGDPRSTRATGADGSAQPWSPVGGIDWNRPRNAPQAERNWSRTGTGFLFGFGFAAGSGLFRVIAMLGGYALIALIVLSLLSNLGIR